MTQEKLMIIDKINSIIREYGRFTIGDVEAESSPILETRDNFNHLAELFMVDSCEIQVYHNITDGELGTYKATYDAFEQDQLDYILELAERWRDSKEE